MHACIGEIPQLRRAFTPKPGLKSCVVTHSTKVLGWRPRGFRERFRDKWGQRPNHQTSFYIHHISIIAGNDC
eukprot:3573357-Pyramimonas_sp.AAC.1